MERITFDILTADGRRSTATLAGAGMCVRGFASMEAYAADFVRRHEASGNIVSRRGVALAPSAILSQVRT